MKTECDRYWWRMNQRIFLIFLLCLPLALLFPFLSLLLPVLFLFLVCDRFLTFHTTAEEQHDALRLMMTMPFSRQQVYTTYVKGLSLMSATYAFLILIIRSLLVLFRIPLAALWSDKISTASALLVYMALLLIDLLATNLILVCMIDNITTSRKSVYLMLSLFAYPPVTLILMFIKSIILFFTGLPHMKQNLEYDLTEILMLGNEFFVDVLCGTILLFVLVVLIVFLIYAVAEMYRRFAGRRVYDR